MVRHLKKRDTTAEGDASFWGPLPTVEQLAAEQGIAPVTDVEALYGDFWPEDESADAFIAAVRHWRRGETSSADL